MPVSEPEQSFFEKFVEAAAKRKGVSLDEIKNMPPPSPGFLDLGEPVQREDATPSALMPEVYDCPKCHNRGYRVYVDAKGVRRVTHCECAKMRENIMRLKRSGLAESVTKYSFETYQTRGDSWREALMTAATAFAAAPAGWFYIGGGTGTGKTHICAAICRELILKGLETRYMMWRDDAPKAKQAVNDREEYQALVQPWKDCQVLYIDDFFKTGKADGKPMRPTAADVNLAYEILNNRYMDPRKVTIISAELSVPMIVEIDSAVGGRIVEMARGHIFSTKGKPDWRLT